MPNNKSNLFLQGDIAAGKSTLLQKILLPHWENVGGFFVQRIYKGEQHIAFRLSSPGNAGDYQLNIYVEQLPQEKNIFLYRDEDNRWQTQLAIFEQEGVKYLQKSREEAKKIILMDEIGGVELQCPRFMQAVLQIFDGPQPVLGVLKAPQNVKRLHSRLAKQEKIEDMEKTPFLLREHPQVKLLEFNRRNYDNIKMAVEAFVNNALQQNVSRGRGY